jgi:quercetin dioxygenase-like cupin family protein
MLAVFRIDDGQAGPPPEPQNFLGTVRMQNLGSAGGAAGIEVLAVFFDAGARTRPHVHSTDQLLYFVRGGGFVAFPGEEEQPIEAGEIVMIPAGRLHMHGARETAPLCHLALRATGPTDWNPELPKEWSRWVA